MSQYNYMGPGSPIRSNWHAATTRASGRLVAKKRQYNRYNYPMGLNKLYVFGAAPGTGCGFSLGGMLFLK